MMTEVYEVGPTKVENYRAVLKDKYRPPSKGGNTRAWHQHSFEVDGERYAFLGLGSKRWIYASDSVTFRWSWDKSRQYRNVIPETIRTFAQSGKEVVRGERGSKNWRTAETRLPVSRREARD